MLNFFVTEYLYLSFGAGIGAKEPVERHMGWSIVAVEVGVVQQVVVCSRCSQATEKREEEKNNWHGSRHFELASKVTCGSHG